MSDAHIVTIGTFDGVHTGHRAILSAARERARVRGLDSTAYTFTRPPRSYAHQAASRILLLPPEIKRMLLSRYVDRIIDASFPEVRDLPADEFVSEILVSRLNAIGIVVGEGFRFGRGREGTAEVLRKLGERHEIAVQIVPRVFADGEPASSTRIRDHLRAGEIGAAAQLLGRPPLLFGTVVEGDRLGRKMGYPTANLAINPHVLLPEDGIYFVHAFLNTAPAHGLLYVGSRPTFNGGETRCEVYLLSPPREDLYGAAAEIHILDRLRGDRAFSSAEALARQIAQDVAHAQECARRFPLTTDTIAS